MLPAVIYEPDVHVLPNLRAGVIQFAAATNREILVRCATQSETEALGRILEEAGIQLVMLGVAQDFTDAQKRAVGIGEETIRRNRDNYIVYCLHNPGDAEKLIHLFARPAGILLFPFTPRKLVPILERILADYESLSRLQTGLFLNIETGNRTFRLPACEISYIEAVDKKTTIYTRDQSLTIRKALSEIASELPDFLFRCHRSYIVNLREVESVSYPQMEIRLSGGERLPLSRSWKDELKRRMASSAEAPDEA